MWHWVAGAVILALLGGAIFHRAKLKLSINEIATLTLSFASLGVAYLAYLQTLDDSDLKAAINKITYLGEQTFRQANATRDQVRELANQTAEMNLQTESLGTSANSSVSLASSATAQISQRDTQFSLEQRPLIRWDQDSDASKNPFSDDNLRGLLKWNYGLRNSGKSIAYNVTAVEGISLWGKPFVETARFVSREYAPDDTSWSTAQIKVNPSELPIKIESRPALRVKVSYRDGQGKRYTYLLCHQFQDIGGAPHDCSQLPIASLPSVKAKN